MSIFSSLRDRARQLGSQMLTTLNTPLVGAGGLIADTSPPAVRGIQNHTRAQLEHMERIVVARAYHDGKHGIRLTPRLREFLGDEWGQFALRLNMCRKITKAISERLVIEGFDSSLPDGDEKGRQIAFAAEVWNGSRMKGKRARTFSEATRDGDLFVLIDFDNEANRPRYTPHAAYTDPQISHFLNANAPGAAHGVTNRQDLNGASQVTGDGEGMWLKYPNDDTDQKPLYAVKRWRESFDELEQAGSELRINFYFPDHIEKYAFRERGWILIDDLPWLDRQGAPLGVPVVHLQSPELLPAAFEAIPLQRALNKALTDLLASSDANAFRILIALGWMPADKDGKPLQVEPGVWVGTSTAGGSVQVVEGADLSNQIAVLDKIVAAMADAVDVPLSLLNRSNQRAAEGTLQEEKESFAAKIRDYQEAFEMAFEDAFKIARRLHNAFADFSRSQIEAGYGELQEEGSFAIKWAPFSVRSIADRQIEAAALAASGVPDEEIWARVWGYSPEQIEGLVALRDGDGFPDLSLQGADDVAA